ncbi:MAG: hypothetical protein K0V04_34880, partial [Deltaproteobacteria bacterium]|nr:hypothetical protein [Deltaproteobacteria bacterium]
MSPLLLSSLDDPESPLASVVDAEASPDELDPVPLDPVLDVIVEVPGSGPVVSRPVAPVLAVVPAPPLLVPSSPAVDPELATADPVESLVRPPSAVESSSVHAGHSPSIHARHLVPRT